MLHIITILINIVLLNFIFIKESWIKMHLDFHRNIKQHNRFQIKIINVSWAANKRIWMISEGSCDTEDWSIDAENSALTSKE